MSGDVRVERADRREFIALQLAHVEAGDKGRACLQILLFALMLPKLEVSNMAANTAEIALEQSIAKLIKTGRFESQDDILREGVRLIEAEEAHWAELDAGILRGIDDAIAGRTTPAEEVFDRLKTKYEAMANAKWKLF
jgi:antitoxin ParD1/3/4